MMIAEKRWVCHREPNGRFPKACAGLYRARFGFCGENLLGSFREETVGTSSALPYSHLCARRGLLIVLYTRADLGKSGSVDCFI